MKKYITINTDDKMDKAINNVRILLSRLGNIIIKKTKKEIKEKLYEIENKTLTKTQKERALAFILN